MLSFITRLFTLIFLYSMTLNASLYDDEVLTVFAKIAPRLVLMSSQKERIKGNIEICVVNDKTDDRIAISLINKIHEAYAEGIKNYKINATNSTYFAIDRCQKSQLIFLLNTGDKNIEKALQYAHQNGSLSMSYDPKYLENGVNASLFLGRKVSPYLNINTLHKNGIEVENVLIQISKIYLNEDEKK